jgi:hypothetical protein
MLPVPAAHGPQVTEKPSLLEDYADDVEVARALKIHVKTLRKMPDGPPFVEVARRRRYPKDLFKKWYAKRVQGR